MNIPAAFLPIILALAWTPVAFAEGSIRKVSDAQKIPDNAHHVRVFRPADPEGVYTELAKRKSIHSLHLSPNGLRQRKSSNYYSRDRADNEVSWSRELHG